MEINKSLFIKELHQITEKSYFKQFSNEYNINILIYRNIIEDLPEIFELKNILPKYDLSEPDFYNWSVKTMFLCKLALLTFEKRAIKNTVINGDLIIEDNKNGTLIEGNLIVNGNIIVKGKLTVVGGVHIKGYWIDTYTDIAETAIAGNLFIEKYLLSEGNLSVGGILESPSIYLSYNQGFGTILLGCNSNIFIENDHGGSWIFGKFKTNYLIFDELKLEFEKESNLEKIMQDLSKIFQSEFISEHIKFYNLYKETNDFNIKIFWKDILNEIYEKLSEKENIFLI